MDYLFERLKVPIVHIGLHEIDARTFVYIPQRRRFVFPEKRLSHRGPFPVRILWASQEAAHSQIQKLEALRVGSVAESVGRILFVKRKSRIRRQSEVGGHKIGEQRLLTGAPVAMAFVAVSGLASE